MTNGRIPVTGFLGVEKDVAEQSKARRVHLQSPVALHQRLWSRRC